MARPRVAAGVLYRNDIDEILLVKPRYKDGWDLPGGYVEPGESPLTAAHREVVEELGGDLPVSGLLLVDWAPAPTTEGDKLLFVFDGGILTADQFIAITPDGVEIASVAFHDVADLPGLVPQRLVKRLSTALTVVAGKHSAYAEHGCPVEF